MLKPIKSLYFVLFLAWTSVVCYCSFPDPQGTDFYPIWTCSNAIVMGADPYSTFVNNKLSNTWEVVQKKQAKVAPICAYPLPFYLITLPFGLLPFAVSFALWFALSLSVPLVFLFLRSKRPSFLWVPLLFYPLFHGATLKTSSVLWVGFFALALFLLSEKKFCFAALVAGIASAKPQIGALLFVYSLVIFIRLEAGKGRWPLILLFSPWIISWIYDSTWLERWFAALQSYESGAVHFPFLPWEVLIPVGAVSVYVFSKLSPVAGIAAAQFLVFPVNDLYSSLPLMLCWVFIEPPQFLLILVTALIPFTYAEPNQMLAVQISTFLPLFLASVLQLTKSHFFKRHGVNAHIEGLCP